MDALSALVMLAALATLYALVSGICATVADAKVGGLDSNQWMFRRVGLQAAAIAGLLFALLVVP